MSSARQDPSPARLRRAEVFREAEAQRALAELFPHLKLAALRAIQDLFPLQAQAQAQARSSESRAAA